MRKLYMLLALLCFLAASSNAQYVDIPNAQFRTFLKGKYPSCFNASSQMNTLCSLITAEDTLEFHELGLYDLGDPSLDIDGIQYFTSLRYLDCSYNYIKSAPALPASLLYVNWQYNAGNDWDSTGIFPVMPNSVTYFDFSYNHWSTALPSLPTSLHYLDCSSNGLPSLPSLPVNLDTLKCNNQLVSGVSDPSLSTLPTLPSGLKYLDCSRTAIGPLPVLPAGLKYLRCEYMHHFVSGTGDVYTLTSLPALPPTLESLWCAENNALSSLPALPSTLKELDSWGCGYTTLPALPSSLLYVKCGSNNQLTSLPALPSQLQTLDCSFSSQLTGIPALPSTLTELTTNQGTLTTLPDLPDGLMRLQVSYNHLTSLPTPLPSALITMDISNNTIHCLPFLPASLGIYGSQGFTLTLDNTDINCLPNTVPGINVGNGNGQQVTLPLCNPTNNSYGCIALPVLAGNIYHDMNSNGSQQAGEQAGRNVKVQLDNGLYAFSDNNGHYEITGHQGTNTLTINPPAYYNVVPPSFTYSISSYDTLITSTVAMQPAVTADSLMVSIVPVTEARPGFAFSYNIKYENAGTTTLSPTIQVNYDDVKLDYSSSSNGSVVDIPGTLTLSVANLVPGQRGEFTANFGIDASTTLGDLMTANASITAGAETSSDTTYSFIIGSFDPNDKYATKYLTREQVDNGNYIDYLIRFQNTGSATAINIVVTDTISSSLLLNSVKMVASSHNCSVTQDGNKLLFEFKHINLPTLNSNEAASHGYIRFAVRPQSGLPDNFSINNKASIYFDYNAPIVTPIATTIINFTTVPLSLLEFRATKEAGNKAMLYWRTANEVRTEKFEILQSNDGRNFTGAASVPAFGNGDNAYNKTLPLSSGTTYFRLKMFDTDGRYSFSNIIKLLNDQQGNGFALITNPAKNYLAIDVFDNSLVNSVATIVNAQGIVVKKFIIVAGTQHINVSDLQSAVYFINIRDHAEKILINK